MVGPVIRSSGNPSFFNYLPSFHSNGSWEMALEQGVSPTLRVWQLAESLRNYREQKELTIEAAAGELRTRSPRWSKSKLQRIETRLYVPKPHEVEQLAEFYDVPPENAEALVRMAGEARQKGWWQSSAMPKHLYTFVGLEQAATTIRQFELALVRGLLQTSEYARALISAIEPATPPEMLENLVAARMVRQQTLKAPHRVKLQVVLSESVIRCPVGAKWVMRGQLEHLIEVSHELDVTVQVLPLAVGPNPGMEGAFSIMTLPELSNDVGYVEGIVGAVYLETQDDVRRCTMRFAALSSMALSPTASEELISSTLEEYR
ncbi:helix-turn-helix domain-containing protein [Saccharopolyspora erythraea]|uniref:helix-turn-helix domain-containing protein n=1 Tax=Saccharopolyspora erythraea TaxID=1836 RepID=UPI001BAC0A3D|nr:helix-turn-helix transcriptional regulator [Saccharopolyspora erythraea]QUH04553.1 helix-turn-helix domain-containing protein [Saccharopolyspora erythraea]